MKKILITIGGIILLGGMAWGGLYWFGSNLAGGGGISEIAPDTVQTGQPATVKLELSVRGGEGRVMGRYTDIVFYYRKVGETNYKSLTATPVPIVYTGEQQKFNGKYESYSFIIPPYPKGTTGEIEYYYDMKLDGQLNHTVGLKKIKIVDSTTTSKSSIQLQSTSTPSTIQTCGSGYKYYYADNYRPIDTQTSISLEKNTEISNLNKRGYTLQELCTIGSQVFAFFDFTDGYWNPSTTTDKQIDSSDSSGNIPAAIEVMTPEFAHVNSYIVTLSHYLLDGPGGSVCRINNFVDGYILYSCGTGNGGYSFTDWYAYDTNKNVNIIIKSWYNDNYSSLNKTDIYRPDLLKLFSSQAFIQ